MVYLRAYNSAHPLRDETLYLHSKIRELRALRRDLDLFHNQPQLYAWRKLLLESMIFRCRKRIFHLRHCIA